MVVLVTGAGGGLGRVVAAMMVKRGAELFLTDRDEAALAETLALVEAAGATVRMAGLDLTDPDAADRLIERCGPDLSVVINNAAYGAIEAFDDTSYELWSRTLAINVVALAVLTARAGKVMKARGRGRIVNITSPASRMALPNYAAYAASKAAVDSLTRSAAAALAPYGVLVNSVAPGMMDTEMQRATEEVLARVESRDDVEAFLAERTQRVPLGRRAEIEEVAAAVLWLALDAPAYIAAERLNVSGGMDKD